MSEEIQSSPMKIENVDSLLDELGISDPAIRQRAHDAVGKATKSAAAAYGNREPNDDVLEVAQALLNHVLWLALKAAQLEQRQLRRSKEN